MADRAAQWREQGSYFTWTPRGSNADAIEVFHVEAGPTDAPTLLLVHGFPTSSIDWFAIVARLAERFRVGMLDFPGFGFSDKPRGWGYSLARDAELLGFYLDDVLGASSATVLAHDRGDSVTLVHAAAVAAGRARAGLDHVFLTNANIYLPMSNLTSFQRLVLDPSTAPGVLEATTPARLAEGLGLATFTPPRAANDPEIEALAATFAHAEGVAVLHETIQYLVERSNNEAEWLSTLAASSVPTTVIWGLNDTVSPPRVATFVWNEFLMSKPGRNALYFIPDANHYLQNDRPDALVDAVFHALDSAARPEGTEPGAIAPASGAPILVDTSRSRLPSAAEVLRSERPVP